MKGVIKIEPTGSYFKVDSDGYLVNPASKDKLQEKWKPLVDDIVEAYKENYKEYLESVYIRGSVAKGEAVEYISDIDTFAYVNLSKDKIDNDWKKNFREEMKMKYPFTDGIELMVISSEGENINLILNQSVLIHGERQPVEKIRLGKELILHATSIQSRLEGTLRRLDENRDEEFIQGECQWAMKGIVRMGLELVLERSGKYSRDLYPCYKIFSQYYPEKEAEIREVLHLALNPTNNKEVIKEVINGFGNWLQEEIKNEL